ncbi:hypothetical protein BKA69DRAFT_1179451 [Paraphysoderma sedebokerense]|nr:hypothetical protein BKA69DRAFT_1179451 [Paraphysoderma sedebokerense]
MMQLGSISSPIQKRMAALPPSRLSSFTYYGSYLTEAEDEISYAHGDGRSNRVTGSVYAKSHIDRKELSIVANDITKAVKALHDEGFGHFELKEAGLVQRTMQKWDVWKLADFGSARRPDEVLEGQARNIHSLAADLYALSVIFTNVANGADQSEKEKIGQLRSMAVKLQQPAEERPTIDNVINEFEFAGLIGTSVEWVRWFACGVTALNPFTEYCTEQQIRRFSVRGNTTFPCLIQFARQARLIQRYTARAFRPGGKFGGDRVYAIRTEDAYRMLRLKKDQQNRMLPYVADKKTAQYYEKKDVPALVILS